MHSMAINLYYCPAYVYVQTNFNHLNTFRSTKIKAAVNLFIALRQMI